MSGANGNGNGVVAAPPLACGVWSHLPARDLPEILVGIGEAHLNGSLTIHFSNGTPSGNVEWKQKEIVTSQVTRQGD